MAAPFLAFVNSCDHLVHSFIVLLPFWFLLFREDRSDVIVQQRELFLYSWINTSENTFECGYPAGDNFGNLGPLFVCQVKVPVDSFCDALGHFIARAHRMEDHHAADVERDPGADDHAAE